MCQSLGKEICIKSDVEKAIRTIHVCLKLCTPPHVHTLNEKKCF